MVADATPKKSARVIEIVFFILLIIIYLLQDLNIIVVLLYLFASELIPTASSILHA